VDLVEYGKSNKKRLKMFMLWSKC